MKILIIRFLPHIMGMHYEDIPWNLLDAEKGWNLNQYKVANKIESVGIPLFEFARLAMVLRH